MPNLMTIALAFLEGLVLIISPCILPILPLILAGSLTSGRKRPIGIILGFIIAFVLFTLFSRELVTYFQIDIQIIRYVAYGLLILFGLLMLSTYLTEKLLFYTQNLANIGSSSAMINDPKRGFYGGLLFGALIGLIWTPCAGPILAAVIVQTVLQQTNVNSFLVLLAFSIGVAIPMFAIVFFGRQVVTKLNFFRKQAILFRRILGLIIIASVLYMIFEAEPAAIAGISSQTKTQQNMQQYQQNQLIQPITKPYPAPAIAGISTWLNSPPLKLDELHGKVVLIDFWTYSCINCIRTFPYLKDWYAKYHRYGLEIIGVHSPEFVFEKDVGNVKQAIVKYQLPYPVALDNNFVTWQNFNNSYWPAHFLIDKNGYVVYEHFGEGDYNITENNIRFLLNLTGKVAQIREQQVNEMQTPETYLGYQRMEHFVSPEEAKQNKPSSYSFPHSLAENDWALKGTWQIKPESIIAAQAGSSLKFHFNARKVFIVMGSSANQAIRVKLTLNGDPIINEEGKAVHNSSVVVDHHRLYEIITLPHSSSDILQLTAEAPGLELYTFTFGD